MPGRNQMSIGLKDQGEQEASPGSPHPRIKKKSKSNKQTL